MTYQTKDNCDKAHGLILKGFGLVLLMLGGLFWITLGTSLDTAETKGIVKQLQHSHGYNVAADDITGEFPWAINLNFSLKEKQ